MQAIEWDHKIYLSNSFTMHMLVVSGWKCVSSSHQHIVYMFIDYMCPLAENKYIQMPWKGFLLLKDHLPSDGRHLLQKHVNSLPFV